VNKTDYKCPDCNVILITIDTLRADHLGCYGYPRQTSPFIDKLARDGILFRRAFASMPTTAPSHASIFTSLYPLQHKVLKNSHILNDSFLTLAELLSAMNYQTAAFVSAVPVSRSNLSQGTNLSQGFDVFDGRTKKANKKGLYRWANKIGLYRWANKKGLYRRANKKGLYRKAKGTVDAAIKWLDERRSTDRFFLWIHLFDPHLPRNPPESFLGTFRNQPTKDRDSFVRFLLEEHHTDFDFYGNKTEEMLETIKEDYEADVGQRGESTERICRLIGVHRAT